MKFDLKGLNGSNPLGFLAAIGLLRIANRQDPQVRLRFADDGTYRAILETSIDAELANWVAADAQIELTSQVWFLEYSKDGGGGKAVADLKAPPEQFGRYLHECLQAWLGGNDEAGAYAAAFGTSVAVDGKGNTKPTALHFTSGQQQFLDTVDAIRQKVSAEWAQKSLFEGYATLSGQNLRWDPAAERNWALMAQNPTTVGTQVDAPLDWLAFRALPVLPSFPIAKKKIATTAVSGRGDEMKMTWPLWSQPASLAAVRSILQIAWSKSQSKERAGRGIFAVCESGIRRLGQGYGSFSPASISP